jgi:alkylhydroperoxidase family enzyme
MVRYWENLTKLVDTVLSGPGMTTLELRRAVEARAGALSGRQGTYATVPDELSDWVEKVARHAYRTTDEDIESLKAVGYSEDQLFELTVAAALGAARARLERALGTLGEKEGGSQ